MKSFSVITFPRGLEGPMYYMEHRALKPMHSFIANQLMFGRMANKWPVYVTVSTSNTWHTSNEKPC